MPEVCDFCRGVPVKWAYPCRNFVHRGTATFRSHGGWAACEVCHGLISRSERDGLAKRSAYTHPARGRVPMSALVREIRGLHDSFWANREGPPLPDPGEGGDPTRGLRT